MIPPQVIEEIKYRNDIEEVISSYLPLKRAGSNLTGRCPFHSEKTPSFTVFTGTRSFYCFGCGAGGDVVSFIMRSENLEYTDALRFLARRVGLDVPEDNVERVSGVRRERILEMNRAAAKFFYSCLQNSDEAKQYLAKRGLNGALVKHFGIGYAPDSFTALADHLYSMKFTKEEMSEGFLCSISKKNGRSYDIFRNRIMFPVIDVKGDIVAFGGRTIGNDPSEAKYINSSDTPVFNKRRNLFALNFAKNDCAEQMILCEGYMDVVSLHGAGFTNAVASCGTAFTPDQARLMSKYTKSVIISFDSDEAGQRAADKAFAYLGDVGLDTKILKVENAKDPDEYIKKFGKDAFSKLLGRSRTKFDFKFSNIISKYDIKTPDGKVKAASEVGDMLAKVWSGVERDVYMRQVCSTLEIPYEALRDDVARKIAKNEKKSEGERRSSVIRATEGYGDRVNPDRIKNVGSASAEDTVLGILATYPELIPESCGKEIGLCAEDFVTGFNRRVFEKMSELGKGFDIALIEDEFTHDEISRIVKNAVARQGLSENGISVIKQCTEKMRHNRETETLSLEDFIASRRKRTGQ